MTPYLIDLRNASRHNIFDEVEDAVINSMLHFKATSLHEAGFESFDELYRAVERAMRTCRNAGIPVREHFKSVYISDENEHLVIQDWMLSKFAYLLVMLNGMPDNPLVGQLQVRLIQKFIER